MADLKADIEALEEGELSAEGFAMRYLRETDASERLPFSPAFVPNEKMEALLDDPELVAKFVGDPDYKMGPGPARKNWKLRVANAIWASRRRKRARRDLRAGAQYLIAAEGDSWFHYPFGFDCLTHFIETNSVAVSTSAAAGDTLAGMSHNKWDDLLSAIEFGDRQADILMFSGGGNDILFGPDGEAFETMVRADGDPDDPKSFLSDAFRDGLSDAAKQLRNMLSIVRREYPELPIILHGYTNPWHDADGPWIGSKFGVLGIDDLALRSAIVGAMIGANYGNLEEIAQENERVAVADICGKIDQIPSLWWDEIHPQSEGWGIAYNELYAAIIKHFYADFPHASAGRVS